LSICFFPDVAAAISAGVYTDLDSLCYNLFSGQGQMPWSAAVCGSGWKLVEPAVNGVYPPRNFNPSGGKVDGGELIDRKNKQQTCGSRMNGEWGRSSVG
jgi:hypothetical protein